MDKNVETHNKISWNNNEPPHPSSLITPSRWWINDDMISVEITNYPRDREPCHPPPSVPDFRKLSTPRVKQRRVRPFSAVAKIPALSRPMKSKLVAGYRTRPLSRRRRRWWWWKSVMTRRAGSIEKGGGGRGPWPRMCVVCERDNINSRYANTSHRCSRLNINGEVPVIASPPFRLSVLKEGLDRINCPAKILK